MCNDWWQMLVIMFLPSAQSFSLFSMSHGPSIFLTITPNPSIFSMAIKSNLPLHAMYNEYKIRWKNENKNPYNFGNWKNIVKHFSERKDPTIKEHKSDMWLTCYKKPERKINCPRIMFRQATVNWKSTVSNFHWEDTPDANVRKWWKAHLCIFSIKVRREWIKKKLIKTEEVSIKFSSINITFPSIHIKPY